MPEDAKVKEPAQKDGAAPPPPMVDEEPVVTQHEIAVGRTPLAYTATAGRMPLKNEKGEIEGQVFYMAYTKNDEPDAARRPLMFSFNGGPGSPSIWLHLGALGPYRVKMLPDGQLPPPPFQLVPNEFTWLTDTDLVFIDPIGTGYSRAKDEEQATKYWGLKGDIESVAEFIRMYLSRFDRWKSPLYLVGESYGTTRAAGLAGYLIDRGVAFNGLVLVSSILNFQTARFHKGNDLPYVLFLPTYAATAWYHQRIKPKPRKSLRAFLKEVEKWAISDYALALAAGDRLSAQERARIVRRLAYYTGLKPAFVEQSDLRIQIHQFCKELLRDEKRTVGRLDSRFKGIDQRAVGDVPEHDPSMSALRPPYTATFNDYVRTSLGYKTDLVYEVFHGIKKPWDWGSAGEGHPDTSEALRAALSKNPYMRIYIASGFFDLATPYFATEYTLAHLGLDPALRGNIRTGEYEAGHMMYIHEPSLDQLHRAIREFLQSSA